MSEALTENEKTILSKVFEGDFPPFKVLSKQVDYLHVKSRRKKDQTYSVEFGIENKQIHLVKGLEENIEVGDTLFQILESSVNFYISVTVMYGVIRWLQIGADYKFENDLTLKNIFWSNRNDDPLKEGTLVYDASERDYKKAIGYIPMYK